MQSFESDKLSIRLGIVGVFNDVDSICAVVVAVPAVVLVFMVLLLQSESPIISNVDDEFEGGVTPRPELLVASLINEVPRV